MSVIASVGYHLLLAFFSVKPFSFIRSINIRSRGSRQNMNRYGANVSPLQNTSYSILEVCGEEAGRKLHKNVESSIKQVLATTPHETPTIRTLAPHHENYTSSTNQTRKTLLEKQGRAHKRCTPCVDPHTWMCKSGTTSTNLHTAAMWGHGM